MLQEVHCYWLCEACRKILHCVPAKFCSEDGLNCILDTLMDYLLIDAFAPFHTQSTLAITGGTGVYAGATGEWKSDNYGVTFFDPRTGTSRYALLGFFDDEIRLDVPEPSTLMVLFLGLV